MVYCGKPSRACSECRIKRRKVYPSRPILRDLSVLTDLGLSATCLGLHVVNAAGPVPDAMDIEGRSLLPSEIKLPRL